VADAKRNVLHAYDDALRSIELAEACIGLMERMSGATPARCIKQLKHYQQQALDRLDTNAAKLGAPYPGKQS
jgi:uncharacterized protein YbjQ (UPF0145 family)